MLKSLKTLLLAIFSTVNLETQEDYEVLKTEVRKLPEGHPLEKFFEFDKEQNLYYKNIKNVLGVEEYLIVPKPVAFKMMQEVYVAPGTAFMEKREFVYYFKVHGIYVKVRWIEEFLHNNILHQVKRTKSKNFIVKPITAKGPYEHWQIDVMYPYSFSYSHTHSLILLFSYSLDRHVDN